MWLKEVIQQTIQELTTAQIASPRLCAQVLAAHVLGISRSELVLHEDRPLTPAQNECFTALRTRCLAGEPLAYLVGSKEFFSRKFVVSPATLIPRPETEEMCEAVLHRLPVAPLIFADIGCGSGCIGATMLAERRSWEGVLLDISAAALQIAQTNIQQLQLTNRVRLVQGDMNALPFAAQSLDCIVSNPPYVSATEYAQLEHTVAAYEPVQALIPDASGLSLLKALARTAAYALKSGGWCFVEHGAAQGAAVKELFITAGCWINISIQKDLAGHDRWCQAQCV